MAIEKLMQALLTATPAKRRAVEDALLGKTPKTGTGEEDARLLTITAAAKLLGIGRNTVYTLIEDGRLDAVTLNGWRRVTAKSLREFADGERRPNEKTEERHAKWAAIYAAGKAANAETEGGAR